MGVGGGWRWDEPDWPLRATCPAGVPTAVFPARPCAAAAPAPLTCLHPASSLSARLSAHPPVRDRRPPLRGEWFEAAKGIDPKDPHAGGCIAAINKCPVIAVPCLPPGSGEGVP